MLHEFHSSVSNEMKPPPQKGLQLSYFGREVSSCATSGRSRRSPGNMAPATVPFKHRDVAVIIKKAFGSFSLDMFYVKMR